MNNSIPPKWPFHPILTIFTFQVCFQRTQNFQPHVSKAKKRVWSLISPWAQIQLSSFILLHRKRHDAGSGEGTL